MLNFDKYREKINKWLDTEKPLCNLRHALGKEACSNMLCWECREDTFKWLCKEYEPPLLENGDGLKPGDWILVRDFDDQNWDKRQFAFYYEDEFFVAYGGYPISETSTYTRWKQARMLEENE